VNQLVLMLNQDFVFSLRLQLLTLLKATPSVILLRSRPKQSQCYWGSCFSLISSIDW